MRRTRHGSIAEGRFVRRSQPSGWVKALLGMLLAFVCVGGAGGEATVTVTDLGTRGGDYSYAEGLNGAGQVVGVSQTASGEDHAFSWTAASGRSC